MNLLYETSIREKHMICFYTNMEFNVQSKYSFLFLH
jgi:hypothetical protein